GAGAVSAGLLLLSAGHHLWQRAAAPEGGNARRAAKPGPAPGPDFCAGRN
nr:hypothetical protein [Tanacetum cinerariifolium]